MTKLAKMREESFAKFLELAVHGYAADNVASGRWSSQDALLQARVETTRLLPDGFGSRDHDLFEIQSSTSGETVGYLWAGPLNRGVKKVAFVYQICVFPEFRRQGHARSALKQYEAMAKERGADSVALNVFGSNTVAQALYRSLGFGVTSIGMQKDLARDDA